MSLADGRLHLNLVDSSRQLFELDPGAGIDAGDGWLFGAGRASHPAISNAAFRTDDGMDPEEFLARAFGFFGSRGRGFSVWVRGDVPEDRQLEEAAKAAGMRRVVAMPEMVLEGGVDAGSLSDGVDLRRLESEREAEDFWKVAAAAYSSVGFPEEVFAFYENHAGLASENVATFIVYLDDRPVAIAMTIVSRGVAGIYWVGSVEAARGRGLGRAVTAAATNAGFDLGAEIAALQASVMGESLYRKMGFRTLYDYRLLMATP